MSQITNSEQLAKIYAIETDTYSDGHTMYFSQGRICVDTHIEVKDDKAYCFITVYEFNEKENDHTGFFNYSFAVESFIRQKDYTEKDQFIFTADSEDDMKDVYAKHAELNTQYSTLLDY